MSNQESLIVFQDGNGEPIRALVLMAAEAEYGDALKSAGVKPSIVGVGPINAAVNTTKILSYMDFTNTLPDIIINLGSGGSDQLEQGTIVQANSVSYRDMDASGFGFKKGQTPFSSLPPVLPISAIIPGVPDVSISTGAKVISNRGSDNSHNEYDDFDEVVAEMEAYAIYTSAVGYNIPMIKILGISDGQEALDGDQEDWTELLPEIDKKLAQVISNLKAGLKAGLISRQNFLDLPVKLRK